MAIQRSLGQAHPGQQAVERHAVETHAQLHRPPHENRENHGTPASPAWLQRWPGQRGTGGRLHSLWPWLDRTLGGLTSLVKLGPGRRDPHYHHLLRALGAIDRHPASWPTPGDLERMPWGAGQVDAPDAERPAGIDGMWPQPSPWDPELWPTITRLDGKERRDHFGFNATRYLGQLVRLAPLAALEAARGPRLTDIDDRQLVEVLTETSYGQFVKLGVSDSARAAFERVVAPRPQAQWAVVDVSGVRPEPSMAIEGCSAPLPARVLLRRTAPQGSYLLAAIELDGQTLTPEDSRRWQLARLFVLQAASIRLVLGTHGQLHFPHDIINVMTKQLLAESHILSRLIRPHSRFALGLNDAVMNHARSITHNNQQELFTPFSVERASIKRLFVEARVGRNDGSDYTPYRYGQERIGTHTPLGRFRDAWAQAFERFVADVLSTLSMDDPGVARWADSISQWVPGFPNAEQLREPGRLVEAVALHLVTVSVFHTADHHSYAQIPLHWRPWRLRAETDSPTSEAHGPLELDRLIHREDYLRAYLADRMFFRPQIIESLANVKYRLGAGHAHAAIHRFEQERSALDAHWAASPFPASAEISASIQY